MALINAGPTIRSTTVGPLARQTGHPTFTLTLVGDKRLVSVLQQTEPYVTSVVTRLTLQRCIGIAKNAIQSDAYRLAASSQRSFGVYARSLMSTWRMQERFVGVATVGNKKSHVEFAVDPGPVRKKRGRSARGRKGQQGRPTVMTNKNRRRPAKYWHFVEFGVYGHPGHRLVARAVKRSMSQMRASFESTAMEALSRHYKLPPLLMSAFIHSQRV